MIFVLGINGIMNKNSNSKTQIFAPRWIVDRLLYPKRYLILDGYIGYKIHFK